MPEEFAGPRKLRYFQYLLVAVVILLVLGTVLSQFYGFTALETSMMYFARNPMVLFKLAGVFSMIVGAWIAVRFVLERVE